MKRVNLQNIDCLAYGLILLGIVSRLIPHPANFTPIGAIALFAGTYLTTKKSYLIPIVAMFISDLFLGFHNTIPYVYGSFVIIYLFGQYLNKHKNIQNLLMFSLSGSALFFIITNFGVWLHSGMYTHTLDGLIKCYIMAIPFYKNTLTGDLIYGAILFGAYEFVKLKLTHKKLIKQTT